jgi:hypothetical protein
MLHKLCENTVGYVLEYLGNVEEIYSFRLVNSKWHDIMTTHKYMKRFWQRQYATVTTLPARMTYTAISKMTSDLTTPVLGKMNPRWDTRRIFGEWQVAADSIHNGKLQRELKRRKNQLRESVKILQDMIGDTEEKEMTLREKRFKYALIRRGLATGLDVGDSEIEVV